MNNLVIPEPPPSMDAYAPELCFCGRKTVETHEFWFCSIKCARFDALRSLDDPESHYRNVVRKAYHEAGVRELHPRRMASVDHLRPRPVAPCAVTNPPFIPPVTPRLQRKAPKLTEGRTMARFPSLSQVSERILGKKAVAREPAVVAGRQEVLPNAASHAHTVGAFQDHTFQQISLDSIPLPETASLQPRRRARGNPENIFGHSPNMIVPPARKDSLPSYRQMNTLRTDVEPKSRTLRRSKSFAPHNQQDLVMHIVNEMRKDMAESFDLRAVLEREDSF